MILALIPAHNEASLIAPVESRAAEPADVLDAQDEAPAQAPKQSALF